MTARMTQGYVGSADRPVSVGTMLWMGARPRQLVDEAHDDAGDVLVRAVAGLSDDPLEVVAALASATAGSRRLVALHGDWFGGSTIIAADPTHVLEAHDPSRAADALARLAADPWGNATRRDRGSIAGAWIGLIGHAAGAALDTLTVPPVESDGPACPVVALGWYDHLLRHDGRQWWAEGVGKRGLLAAQALADLARQGSGPRAAAAVDGVADQLTCPDAGAHMAAVEHAVTAIRTGEIVQTTLCSRYKFHVKHPAPAWIELVRALSPDYAALITGPWGALLGASPELYLRRQGRTVESAPIKGTSPAAEDPARLRRSAKDVAENVMIVDLVRNDLSRVAVPGTVATTDLLAVRRQAGVNHLVSRVTARLRPEVDDAELVALTFPPGSVTGAPKLRATEVSNRLECAGRGAHTGAVGYVSPGAGLELAVTIRSVEVDADGRAALGVGSGITVGSTPATEWAECMTKATPILRALGLSPAPPAPSTDSAKGLADPAAGLIETLLVSDGSAIELADHTDRLRRSFAEIHGRPLMGDPAAVVRAAMPATGTLRLRLRARSGPASPDPDSAIADTMMSDDLHGDEVLVDHMASWPWPTRVVEQPGLHVAVALAPPDGDERHKYADRSWWESAEAAAGVGRHCDALAVAAVTGELLEGSRSNVFAVIDGRLVTPPADGRILPGTARQQLIDEATAVGIPVELRGLGTAALRAAQGLMLVNSLRGVEWVSRLDTGLGTLVWPSAHPLVARSGELIANRWEGMRRSS